ncbi:MAG: tetratricopeptide repeat protein [Pseudomonadota bacterium]
MSSTPTNFDEAKRAFLAGTGYYEAGRFDEARDAFETSLALLPGRVSTLGNLGATLNRLGQHEAALKVLDEALKADDAHTDAWSHRGEALAAMRRHAEALACQNRVLELNPASAPALYQRTLLLKQLDRADDALDSCTRMLALEPDSTDGLNLCGELCHRLNRHGEALDAFDRLLALNAQDHAAWSKRGGILKDLGRREEAAEAFRKALALGGDAELNSYFLASLTGSGDAPATAPRKYVEALFDDYAGEFDKHLVDVLGYRAHSVLVDNMDGIGPPHVDAALDLGCGTGLCGPLLTGRAGRIDGVDLSSAMLDKARKTGAYSALVQADLAEYLQGTDQRYGLVLSADVFIYVGALEAVFAGVQRVLQAGGLFCFSLESSGADADDGAGYVLTAGQRYAHSQRYIRSLSQRYGFTVLKVVDHPIRTEQGRPLDGLFVYLALTG